MSRLMVAPICVEEEARMDVGGCGGCHPIAAVGLYTLVAQHREHVFERRQTFPDRGVGDFAGARRLLLSITNLLASPAMRKGWVRLKRPARPDPTR
jgi:hypothetical protein